MADPSQSLARKGFGTPIALILRSELARVSKDRTKSGGRASPETAGASFETPLRGSSG
jgi:hypothetical protein